MCRHLPANDLCLLIYHGPLRLYLPRRLDQLARVYLSNRFDIHDDLGRSRLREYLIDNLFPLALSPRLPQTSSKDSKIEEGERGRHTLLTVESCNLLALQAANRFD